MGEISANTTLPNTNAACILKQQNKKTNFGPSYKWSPCMQCEKSYCFDLAKTNGRFRGVFKLHFQDF